MTDDQTYDRFWAKVDRRGPDECWEWTASRRLNGYGAFWFNGRPCSAHRVSCELANGPIPDGLCVMHSCDNRPCVNPAHLSVGTVADNQQDMARKGRGRRELKPTCGRGHLMTPENTKVVVNGGRAHRRCLTCRAITDAAYELKRKNR